MLNNSENVFKYDRVSKTVIYNWNSEIYNNLKCGTYNYEEFNNLLVEAEWIGSFPFYYFENPIQDEGIGKCYKK